MTEDAISFLERGNKTQIKTPRKWNDLLIYLSFVDYFLKWYFLKKELKGELIVLFCISETSTQFEESNIPEEKVTIAEEAVGTLSPEMSPQKNGTYLPSTSSEMSDDFH